jgi:branched-chain amino acid transport system substrate-binding protein
MAPNLKIAIAGPRTGPLADFGKIQQLGAQKAIDDCNAKGGVNGQQVEGVFYDDVGTAIGAASVANKIVADSIKFVIGHPLSHCALPAAGIYEDAGILSISPGATSTKFSEMDLKLTFRTTGVNSAQAKTAAEYIKVKGWEKNMAVFHDSQPHGLDVANQVKYALPGTKFDDGRTQQVAVGEKDYSAQISIIHGQQIKFVFFGGYSPELGPLVRAAKERNLKLKFMASDGADSVEDVICGCQGNLDALDGLLTTGSKPYYLDEKNAKLYEAFDEEVDVARNPLTYASYAAVQVLTDGIANAKSLKSDEVAAVLRRNTFDTSIGQVEFDDAGNMKDFQFVVYEWTESSKGRTLTRHTVG